MTPNEILQSKDLQENLNANFTLPGIALLSAAQLQDLFVEFSQQFNTLLIDCKDVQQLESLQLQLRAIATELQRRHLIK